MSFQMDGETISLAPQSTFQSIIPDRPVVARHRRRRKRRSRSLFRWLFRRHVGRTLAAISHEDDCRDQDNVDVEAVEEVEEVEELPTIQTPDIDLAKHVETTGDHGIDFKDVNLSKAVGKTDTASSSTIARSSVPPARETRDDPQSWLHGFDYLGASIDESFKRREERKNERHRQLQDALQQAHEQMLPYLNENDESLDEMSRGLAGLASQIQELSELLQEK